MAGCALGVVERRAPGKIRREGRGERTWIGGEQGPGEGLGLGTDDVRRRPGLDTAFQRGGIADERGLGAGLRQAVDPGPDLAGELDHLAVFGGVDHLAVVDGDGVVDRYIVEQTPGDLGFRRR